MLQDWSLFLISAAYVALLFAIAYYGDRVTAGRSAPTRKPWTYSLALGVYCTSWTFYGAVGRAADSGWDFLPIYLGPILVFVFGAPLLARVIQVSKRNNITSIADFISARYGRHPSLSMLVTLIAVFGVVPYIALQLKAVAFGFEVLGAVGGPPPQFDHALMIAALLAVFAILFGTRQIVSSENHHGMVLAIAFESVVKLLAFVAVGLYACYGIFGGFAEAYRQALALPQLSEPLRHGSWHAGFLAQTVLAATAMLCLPRQFHVAVVENTDAGDLKRARWVFPLYIGLISLLVLPIAVAGLQHLPAGIAADRYVLALPLAGGHRLLTLVAYLGGFSAATSMVIVDTIALSTMLGNEVAMPLLLRSLKLQPSQRQDLSALLKGVRRIAIVSIIAISYLYYRLFTGPGSLSSIGLLSLAAVAQFAPAVIGGLVWRRGSYQGTRAGLIAGFLLWAYTLLLPTLLSSTAIGHEFLSAGPFGIAWLRPQALFGITAFDSVTHGTLWSLALNLAIYITLPLLSSPGLRERMQANRFLEEAGEPPPPRAPVPRNSATCGDLLALLENFFGADDARAALDAYAQRQNRPPFAAADRADASLLRHTEHLLAGVLGASSARLVLATTLRGRDMQLEDVIRLLDETSHEILFNRELLRATLEHLSQGVSVVDRNLRLVAWNRRYLELFAYPPEMIQVGRPIADLVRYNAERGLLGEGDRDMQVERRLLHMRAGRGYTHERVLPDGTVIEIRGNPMPGGGFVTSYSDVSAYKRTEAALQEINETLETRVADRTQALNVAKSEAEQANLAKTRFLASASHDLVQPLHAARLFIAAVERSELSEQSARLLGQVENSLAAAENLLATLLDISRLDAAAQPVHREHFALATVLEPLAAEFATMAAARGLRFDVVATRAVVESDPRLLRRVLQNFLSNAVRYTPRGRVLIGCRHVNDAIRIEVWDTGRGIAAERRREIFEEFRRLEAQDGFGERGLGLGLAIAERIARLLDHPLSLRSWPGRGSVFAITVPRGLRSAITRPKAVAPQRRADRIAGSLVLCLENEPDVLEGLRALLGSWGCRVIAQRDAGSAAAWFEQHPQPPDLALIDFHLDAQIDASGRPDAPVNGIDVMQLLQRQWPGLVPGIVLTADHTQAAREAAEARGYALLQKPVKPAALRALMSRMLSAQPSRQPA